ncbi:Synaptic vesicle protein EHS-1, EH domain protein [Trachipleistophora hominis]|uniref:Synaptic vesicle protein EHS-1, EH domain protein n=1 Tax=Trachipleistophora hominis TaxID=72359 RepID=L7JV75_TRAHO|nr:Synaptic vesicle protein EHS-1, EH domain protein [Trachipleistophora hominis]
MSGNNTFIPCIFEPRQMTTREFTNLHEIQSITSELRKKFSYLLSESVKKIKEVKYTRKEQKERLSHDIQMMRAEIKKNEEEINRLRSNLEKLKHTLDKERNELLEAHHENDGLSKQMAEYDENKKNLERLVNEIERRVRGLQAQKANEMRSIEANEKKLEAEADQYRKVLGINISQVCDSVLKIEFLILMRPISADILLWILKTTWRV